MGLAPSGRDEHGQQRHRRADRKRSCRGERSESLAGGVVVGVPHSMAEFFNQTIEWVTAGKIKSREDISFCLAGPQTSER